MTPETKKKIQLFLTASLIIVTLRTGYVFYQRYQDSHEPAKKEAPPLNADYYVTPKKLHPYDLKSARQLTQQPVWAREGYRYTYYPYNKASHRSDFAHEAGTLGPIEKLEIKDVVTDITPGAPDQHQVMAVFEKDGKSYAFPIGSVAGTDFRVYSDDMLFIEDPHELYQHWPAEVWHTISKHEVKPGMNQLQVGFSIGAGMPDKSTDMMNRTVTYTSGGKPLIITFRDDKAIDIQPGS